MVKVVNPEEELVVDEEEVETLSTVVVPDEVVPPTADNEEELVEVATAADVEDVLWDGEEVTEELDVPDDVVLELDVVLTYARNLAPHILLLTVGGTMLLFR